MGLLGLLSLGFVASNKARPFTATISRAGGAGFYSDASSVRNIYKIRVFNKRNQTATVTIKLGKETPAGYQLSGSEQSFSLAAHSEMSRTCVVFAPLDSYGGTSDIVIEVHADPGDVVLSKNARFLGPNPQSIKHTNP